MKPLTVFWLTFSFSVALAGLGYRSARAADEQVLHAPVDVCSLVSVQTAAAILGSHASTQTSDPASYCLWTSPAEGGSGLEEILMFVEWPGPTEVTHLAQAPNFGVAARSGQRVTELPAAAMWLEPTPAIYADHELLVLSGGMVMSIFVATSARNEPDAGSAQYAAAVTFAKAALLNLP